MQLKSNVHDEFYYFNRISLIKGNGIGALSIICSFYYYNNPTHNYK